MTWNTKNILNEVFNLLDEFIVITNFEGEILFCNDKFKQMFFKEKHATINNITQFMKYEQLKQLRENQIKIDDIKIDARYFPVKAAWKSGNLIIVSRLEAKEKDKIRNQLDELSLQLEKASKVHEAYLPKCLPQYENIEFASYYCPAEKVGGDLYGIQKVDHGAMNLIFDQVVVYLVDVTGHSIDSTLLSTFVKDTIENYFTSRHKEGEYISPGLILDYLKNVYLKEDYPGDYFIAIFLGVFDFKLKEFVYTSAGIQYPPLLVRNNETVLELEYGGIPISTSIPDELMVYEDDKINLENKDKILFYTDGIAEQRNEKDKTYFPRLKNVFKNNGEKRVSELKKIIKKDFKKFLIKDNKPEDDVTFLLAELSFDE